MARLSLVILFVFVVATVFCAIEALECGIDSNSNSKDLRQIADNCMKKNGDEKKKSTLDPEDDEDMKENTSTESSSSSGGNNKRNKRNDDNNSKNSRQSTERNNDKNNKNDDNDRENSRQNDRDNNRQNDRDNSRQSDRDNNRQNNRDNNKRNGSDNSRQSNRENREVNNNNSTSGEKDNCVVHCIFGQMGMVDGEGFPVHHRVLNALLNNAKGRELRDFVQDTTDECFQLMEQGDNQDPCLYSVTLVNCLAERGKSNCSDWPIGNLPFLTKKN